MGQQTTEVTTFINDLQHPLKRGVELLREIVLSANEDITEHIKWNAPSFCYQGEDRLTFNLHKKDCIRIVFHRGAKVKDSKDFVFEDSSGLLDWSAKDRGMVTFHDVQEIEEKADALKTIANQWIQATTF